MPIPSSLVTPAIAGAQTVRDRTDPQAPDKRLEVKPNYEWHYACYPQDPGGWMVQTIEAEGPDDDAAGTWWLPVTITLKVKPGVAGGKTLAQGEPPSRAYFHSHQRVIEDGGVIIPRDLGYMVEAKCTDPRTRVDGVYYASAWDSPRTKIRGRRLKFDFDRQRFYRFLLMLVREGYVDPPDPAIVDMTEARLASRVDRKASADFKGDDATKDRLVGEAMDLAETAADAAVPQRFTPQRPAPQARKTTMSYAQLKAAAAELGHKTHRRTKADLQAIVDAGVPFEGDE